MPHCGACNCGAYELWCMQPSWVTNLHEFTNSHDFLFSGFDSFIDYLSEMEKERTCGDGIVLSAASMCYKRPVTVLYQSNPSTHSNTDNDKPTVIVIENEYSDSPPMYLVLVNSSATMTQQFTHRTERDHYVSLISSSMGLFHKLLTLCN